MDEANDPIRRTTKRQSGKWWIIALVVLVAGAIFLALGRTQRDVTDTSPLNPPATPVIRPDQIENTLRTQDGWEHDPRRELEPRNPQSVKPIDDHPGEAPGTTTGTDPQ